MKSKPGKFFFDKTCQARLKTKNNKGLIQGHYRHLGSISLFFFKEKKGKPEDMSQWLRALTALQRTQVQTPALGQVAHNSL